MKNNLNLGVIGIDHGHIFDMLDEMLKEGCTCNYFWTEGSPLTLDEFNKKYPNIKRVENKNDILNDNKIDMILISSIPKDRASHSIESLNSGKDVMVDKPGCTTLDQLEDLNGNVTAEVGDVVYTTENQKPFDNYFGVNLYHVINEDTKKQVMVSEDNIERIKL